MNLEKIKIAKKLKISRGMEIDYKDIIWDLKTKSLYTYIKGRKVGCYWDSGVNSIVWIGDIAIAEIFVDSLSRILRGKV